MARRHDPTRVRRHWVYTRAELCGLLNVGSSTVANWMNAGLKQVDKKRPQLFAGFEVARFLTTQRWPEGRTPKQGKLYCWPCQGFRALQLSSIQIEESDTNRKLVKGQCSACHNMTQTYICTADLAEIYQASSSIARDTPDVLDDGVFGLSAKSGARIPPESSSTNMRLLYEVRVFLQRNRELDDRTVDEYLRSIAKLSAFLSHKPFERITIQDVCSFKDAVRMLRDSARPDAPSNSVVTHTLDRCRIFLEWLLNQPDVDMHPDLPGYLSLSRRERLSASADAKDTDLTFDQALYAFKSMPGGSSIELRNRALMALFIVTGIRAGAAISLRGKHVNIKTRWINQDPREVNTKLSKYIRTYCLDLGSGLLEAIGAWSRWREANGFGDADPFFLPNNYLQSNGIGLGFRSPEMGTAECWKTEGPSNKIIEEAFQGAGIVDIDVSSSDFRKILHPFLVKRGKMRIEDEIALQLNLGHTPTETIRKHYSTMRDSEREAILDDLCRRALSDRSELELYLAYQRGEISETDSDYRRAKGIFERHGMS